MPAINYNYDPYANSPANKIDNELHTLIFNADKSLWPLHGPFYVETLKVESNDSGTWVELNPQEDFVYSPLFISVSASTAKDAATYLVFLKDYTTVRVSYQAVGKYEDTYLLQEIIAKTDLDRSDIYSWFSVRGQQAFFNEISRDPSIGSKGLLETLVAQFGMLTDSVSDPYAAGTNIGPKVTAMDVRLTALNVALNSILPTPYTDTVMTSGSNKNIYQVTTGKSSLIEVLFEADDGDVDSAFVNVIFINNANGYMSEMSRVNAAGDLFTLAISSGGGAATLRAVTTKNGTMRLRPVNMA